MTVDDNKSSEKYTIKQMDQDLTFLANCIMGNPQTKIGARKIMLNTVVLACLQCQRDPSFINKILNFREVLLNDKG